MAKATLEWRVETLRKIMSMSYHDFWIPPSAQDVDWFSDMQRDGLVEAEYVSRMTDDDLKAAIASNSILPMVGGSIHGYSMLHVTTAGEQLVSDFDHKKVRREDHNLLAYWRLADWSERLGMVLFFCSVLTVGYLCASNQVISRIIALIRDMKP